MKQYAPWLAAITFCLDLVLGGGARQGFLSDALLQLASLPLILMIAVAALSAPVPQGGKSALVILALMFFVPMLQLVPLPPEVWSALPGRGRILDAFQQSGANLPWLPVSLSPEATEREIFALLPPLSIFLSVMFFGSRLRYVIAIIIVGAACLSVVLGLAQIAGGPTSILRFYRITNYEQAVGFFANRNHYSALLYSSIPLLGAFAIWKVSLKQSEMLIILLTGFLLFVVIMLGIGLAASRAGLLLSVAAALGVIGLASFGTVSSSVARKRVMLLGAGLTTCLLVVGLVASQNISNQVDKSVLHDSRIEISLTSWVAANAFAPVGSGLGTFVPVYQMFELPAEMTSEYTNHAHDDWLELWLEAGLPGISIALAFSIWLIAATRRTWREEGSASSLDGNLARAATLIVFLLLFHSIVDYPLRTEAMSCVFAFACGLLLPRQPSGDLDLLLHHKNVAGVRANERRKKRAAA